MRLNRDHLAFKALCVLKEASEQAHLAPVAPSAGLRFALAYLWSHSRSADRWAFDNFWRAVIGRVTPGKTEYSTNVGRQNDLHSCFAAIARSVGFEPNVDLDDALKQARGLPTWPAEENRRALQKRASPNGHARGTSDPA